jgi:hypothetical protein
VLDIGVVSDRLLARIELTNLLPGLIDKISSDDNKVALASEPQAKVR